MEDHRRTRSQGLPEGEQLIQWDSLQDPVRIEREQAEARRQAREASVVININRGAIENSEIPQVTEGQPRFIAEAPQFKREISKLFAFLFWLEFDVLIHFYKSR